MGNKAVPFLSRSPPVCLELYAPSVMSEPKNANISAHVTSSSELLAEKSGLGGCELEYHHEGGHGSSLSSVPADAYFSLLLSKSIMIYHM
jgi:hypothetical protein